MAFLPSLARPVTLRVTRLGRVAHLALSLTAASRRRCLLNKIAVWESVAVRCCSGPDTFSQTTFIARKQEEDPEKDILAPHSPSQHYDPYSLETTKEFLLPSQQQRHQSDLLLSKIKECELATNALELYRRHKEVMDTKHFLALIERLGEIVDAKTDPEQLQRDEDFKALCSHLFIECRRMVVDDCLRLFKCLCRLEVQSNSKLTLTVLQMIKNQINDLSLRHLIFLDFLLKKITLTPLSDALLTATPILISNALTTQQDISDLSFAELSQAFSICCGRKVAGAGVLLQEMYRRGSVHSAPVAMSLVWTLTGLSSPGLQRKFLSKEEQLTKEVIMKECFEILARDMDLLTSQQVESIHSKVCNGHQFKDRSCYNERFLHAVASYFCRHSTSFEKAGHAITKMVKMNYLSDELVRYTAKLIMLRPEGLAECKVPMLPLVSSLTSSSLPQEEIHKALDVLRTHNLLTLDSEYYKKPLVSLAIELLSVEYYHPQLMEILTSPDTVSMYMSRYPKADFNHRKLLEVDVGLRVLFPSSPMIPDLFLEQSRVMIANQQPSRSTLKAMLSQIFDDPEILVSGVLTETGTYIDHLLVLDAEGTPVTLRSSDDPLQRNPCITSLDFPPSATKLAILDVGSGSTFRPTHTLKGPTRLRRKVLEADGFKVLPLLQAVIFQHYEEEKILYVKRELCEAGVTLT